MLILYFLAYLVYQSKSLIQSCFVGRRRHHEIIVVGIVCAHSSHPQIRHKNFIFWMSVPSNLRQIFSDSDGLGSIWTYFYIKGCHQTF